MYPVFPHTFEACRLSVYVCHTAIEICIRTGWWMPFWTPLMMTRLRETGALFRDSCVAYVLIQEQTEATSPQFFTKPVSSLSIHDDDLPTLRNWAVSCKGQIKSQGRRQRRRSKARGKKKPIYLPRCGVDGFCMHGVTRRKGASI